MARTMVIDEFHLTVRASPGLPRAEYDAIYRTLNDRRFQALLRRAVRAVLRQYEALAKVRAVLSR